MGNNNKVTMGQEINRKKNFIINHCGNNWKSYRYKSYDEKINSFAIAKTKETKVIAFVCTAVHINK